MVLQIHTRFFLSRYFSSGGREKREEKFYKVEVEVESEVDLDKRYDSLVLQKKLNELEQPDQLNYMTTRRIVVISDGSYRPEDSSKKEDLPPYSSIAFVVLDCGLIRSFHGQRFDGIILDKEGKIITYGSSTRSEMFSVLEIGRYLNRKGIKNATIVVDLKIIEQLWNGKRSKIANNIAASKKIKQMKRDNPGFVLIWREREEVKLADVIARHAGEGTLSEDILELENEEVEKFIDRINSLSKFD